ncbi:hypothetical protein B5M09_012408 [Aphanomyces astaci]|uniref:Tc1-like transposase DDE domain-containing protein n=1 Tax=Aphanomyces astaci TaxID=112090 RepID=A0A3R7YWY4_APHAT|nr:hypothetical protein B5M09_012408 [Aphanomyces astaci]
MFPLNCVAAEHASKNTIAHALYAYYHIGMKKSDIAHVFHKSPSTIANWIVRFESRGHLDRKDNKNASTFTQHHRSWIVAFFEHQPMSFLDEAKRAFEVQFKRPISISTVWSIIHRHGMTWKVLERRAMHIKEKDIHRFFEELSLLDWTHSNIQFLDEVSFDSKGMLRKKGYAMKGQKLCFRGEFVRRPRISLLCFIDVNGVSNVFETVGTFDRAKFVECCWTQATAGAISPYPGRGSIWIMDGASIHCHPDIPNLLRSVGIVPLYLPSYCAFFNPIEYLFGYVKKAFRRHYRENHTNDLLLFVMSLLQSFKRFDLSHVYRHCGYGLPGHFDPSTRLTDHAMPCAPSSTEMDDLLDFMECRDDDNE